jgi:DNA repair exonuclease SbcCD ATPase subunit
LELEAAACEEKARDLGKLVRKDLRERAARRELDGPETVSADLERARRDLASLGEPPSADVRAEHDHHRRNVEQLELHLMDRDRELREADEELTRCRQRYLEVVSHTLLDYRRRAVELGREADVQVEMELPKLVDDDRALAEAGIEASFGFDGKDPLPMRHSSFSGGQQVIAGLVLLMAMAETEGRGFFMLDEPFAHLSLDRVDQVGRFLRNSRSQFILTAPTTLDRVQLDPASLVIVLRKKHPDETFAPVPIVAEA